MTAVETRPVERVVAMAWRPVSVVAAVAAVVHLSVATRYGWHRDEFYYVISGRHLAFGYVDQPPLTPLLARLAADLPGGLLPLRVLAVAAQIACVVLAAKLAAEFGGGRRAQTLTAAAMAACPLFVGTSFLFGTSVVDQVVWVAVFVLVARALRLPTNRSWLGVGLVAGVGMENKDTVVVLLVGVAVGLVLLRRDVLRTPGPWLAGVVTVVLALPNVVWNATHGWPQVRMAGVLAAEQGGALGSLAQFAALPLVFAGPPLILLWVWGVRWLGSAAGRDHRWMLVVAVVTVVVFTASGGKFYYAGPPLAGLFAAGSVRVETLGSARGRTGWPLAVAVSGVLAVVVWLPVLPVSVANVLKPVSPFVLETYGWPDFVDQVTKVAATLPPDTTIFASNYGEAGSLTMLGPAAGLRDPVSGAQNAYGDWGPPPGTPDTVLCVGTWTADELRQYWSQVREIAPITNPEHIDNEESTLHAGIYLCQRPRGTWAQLWPSLRHID
jgi:Dolichyl-phosphate-mannose-protein mannosyltransferase